LGSAELSGSARPPGAGPGQDADAWAERPRPRGPLGRRPADEDGERR